MVTMPDVPVVLPTYQLPAVPMSRKDFAALPFRDDIAAGEHQHEGAYQTREGYPNDIFFWVEVAGAESGGEWRRGPVAFTD